MKHFILIFFFLNSIAVFSQTASPKDTIYKFEQVDKEPAFDGGQEQFKLYLQRNIKYPKESKKNGVEGRVFTQFVVEANGEITNIKILKGLDEYCDEEAVRILSKMPKWTPGQKNGRNVRTYFNLPLKFSLPKD